MLRSITFIGSIAVLVGCAGETQTASSPAPRSSPPPPDVEHAVGLPSALALIRQSEIASAPLQASPADLWVPLMNVYNQLDLSPTVLSTETRLIGIQRERLRRIGRQPISRYFECPGTGYGNTASTEFVVVTAVAQLIPVGAGGSELRLATGATARGGGSLEARCRSTGLLERQIRQALEQAAASAP